MPGNKIGGAKAAAKNIARDPDFYKRIGQIGGRNGNTGGFASSRELAQRAGRLGGLKSKRKPAVKVAEQPQPVHKSFLSRFTRGL